MKYTLTVPLPQGPVMNYLRAIVRQLNEHFGLETSPAEQFWSYVVVCAPFEIPIEKISEFQKLLASSIKILSEAHQETQFSIDGYVHFENLIGLKVLPSSRMELIVGVLHETLTCLPWVTQEGGVSGRNFYVTVAEKFPSVRFNNIWKHLTQKSVPHFDLSFTTIELLRLEEGLWVVDSAYSLAH